MTKIVRVLHIENKGDSATLTVQLTDGTEAVVWVGGSVQVWFDERYGKIKAFVNKSS